MKKQTSIWQHLPDIQQVASAIPLSDLIEPVITEPLNFETTLLETIEKINRHQLDFVFVVDDGNRLAGLVTRSDLLRAFEVAAATPEKIKETSW